MSSFDFKTMKQGKFRGIEFFIFNDGNYSPEKSTIIHKIANSNLRIIEDLGGNNKAVWTLDIYVENKDNFKASNKLQNALNQDGVGVLIHPFDGRKTVSATIQSRVHNFGHTKFTVRFSEADNVETPQSSISSLADLGQEAIKSNAEAKSIFQKSVDFLKGGYETFQKGITKTKDTTTKAKDIVKQINNNVDKAGEVLNQLNSIDSDINALIRSPVDLSNRLEVMFNNFLQIGTLTKDSFNASKEFYGFGSNDDTSTSLTFNNQAGQDNNKATNEYIRILNFNNSILQVANIDYKNTEELDGVKEQLNIEYDNLVASLEGDSLINLKTIKSKLELVLQSLEKTIPKINIVTLQGLHSIHTLVNNYYGDFASTIELESRIDDILSLNNFSNPSMITGEVKLLNA